MPKKITLTPDELKTVTRSINLVWQEIATDLLDMGPCDNEQAVECCLDADRLDRKETKEADAIIDRLFLETSYNTTLKFLAKNIRLV
jgi:hypothetical protein